MFSSVTNWLGVNIKGKDAEQSDENKENQGEAAQPHSESRDSISSTSVETSTSSKSLPESDSEECKSTSEEDSSQDNSALHTLEDVSSKAINTAKEFGSILFSFGKAAGKTVAEQANKLKTTVEEKTMLGDFNREQEKFVTEKKENKKQEEAAVPPWIGYNEEETMKTQIMALSTVALLSFYDLLFLFTCLLLAILDVYEVPHRTTAVKGLQTCRQLLVWCVTYTLVDISLERCVSLCRPFLARARICVTFTLKRAAVMLALGLLLLIPQVCDIVLDLSTEGLCREERYLTTFGLVYNLYVSLGLYYLLPFTLITVANLVLLCTLRRVGQGVGAVSAAGAETSTSTSTRQLSALVVGLSVWYCACMLAPSLLFLVRMSRKEPLVPETDIVVAAVADGMVELSAAANFLFYFLLWRHFRQDFVDAFCRCRCCCDSLCSSFSDLNDGDGRSCNRSPATISERVSVRQKQAASFALKFSLELINDHKTRPEELGINSKVWGSTIDLKLKTGLDTTAGTLESELLKDK